MEIFLTDKRKAWCEEMFLFLLYCYAYDFFVKHTFDTKAMYCCSNLKFDAVVPKVIFNKQFSHIPQGCFNLQSANGLFTDLYHY